LLVALLFVPMILAQPVATALSPSMHATSAFHIQPDKRRHYFWNDGGGGPGRPFTWKVAGPIIAIAVAAVAVPLYLRNRRRK